MLETRVVFLHDGNRKASGKSCCLLSPGVLSPGILSPDQLHTQRLMGKYTKSGVQRPSLDPASATGCEPLITPRICLLVYKMG